MNTPNNHGPDGDRRAEVERLAAQLAHVLATASPEERPNLEARFAQSVQETLTQINGGADARYRHLKSPPLTPELRAWLDQQHTDEELVAWFKEAMEKGGLEFSEFFPELERIVRES